MVITEIESSSGGRRGVLSDSLADATGNVLLLMQMEGLLNVKLIDDEDNYYELLGCDETSTVSYCVFVCDLCLMV